MPFFYYSEYNQKLQRQRPNRCLAADLNYTVVRNTEPVADKRNRGASEYSTSQTMAIIYRAMHFSAKRGITIACRLSVCLSVCLSVTLVDCDHIDWNSSKIISPLVSLGCSLFATPT